MHAIHVIVVTKCSTGIEKCRSNCPHSKDNTCQWNCDRAKMSGSVSLGWVKICWGVGTAGEKLVLAIANVFEPGTRRDRQKFEISLPWTGDCFLKFQALLMHGEVLLYMMDRQTQTNRGKGKKEHRQRHRQTDGQVGARQADRVRHCEAGTYNAGHCPVATKCFN